MFKIRKAFTLPLLLAFLVGCVLGVSNLPVAAQSGDLVAHFSFDGNLDDSSGNGNNGAAKGTGEITFKGGKVGQGAVFNGSNYIEVADSDSLDLDSAFTFAVWVYKENTDDLIVPLICKGESDDFFTSSYRYLLGYGGRSPSISIVAENESDYDEANSDTEVGTQNWSHIAVTWDGKNIKFYKNGVLTDAKQTEYVTNILHSAQKLLIGMDPVDGTKFFRGTMDELRIYNRALTEGEVTSLADVGKAAPIQQPSTGNSDGAVKIVLQVDNPKMTVNGVEKEVDPGYGTTPVVNKGRALVPIRAIVEEVGGKISFDPQEQKIAIELESPQNSVIEFWAGKNTYKVNGVEKLSDAAPAVMKGRTFLPLRVATENLGASLEWDGSTQIISITFGK